MSLPLLDASIGTRLHRSQTSGPFEVYTVECQGRSPLAFTHTATHMTSRVCVTVISSVCGGRCDTEGIQLASSEEIESYAGVVNDVVITSIVSYLETKSDSSFDWSCLSAKVHSVVQHRYLGVTVTGVLLEKRCEETESCATLFQMGKTVDVWRVCFNEESVCRFSSRLDHLLDVPRVAPVSLDMVASQQTFRTPLAYLPVSQSFGATAFQQNNTKNEFALKTFCLQPNSWLLLHSNGFRFSQTKAEKENENRVSKWLPKRIYNGCFKDAQFDRNIAEVLDHEVLSSGEQETRNRVIVLVSLSKSFEPFSSTSQIRAAKYVPGKSRRFERAFARHCTRLGTDKLKMIALFNEQSGVMAGIDSQSTIARLQNRLEEASSDEDQGSVTEGETDEEEETDKEETQGQEEFKGSSSSGNNSVQPPHFIDCECSECDDGMTDGCYGWNGDQHVEEDWDD